MKRDMDLARQILLQTEEKGSYGKKFVELDLSDVPQQVVSEHVKLLAEAGLIESKVNPRDAILLPVRLTWEGHEFLDAARSQNVWEKVKGVARDQGGSLPFDVLKALAIQFARQAVGL